MSAKPNNYLTVIKQNSLCSVQDLGRMSSQHLGFSAGGAADEYAFLYANYLLCLAQNISQSDAHIHSVNHSPDNQLINHHLSLAQLEITLGQITFKAEQHCTIAITGADCSVCINDKPVNNWQVHQLNPHDIISFNQPKLGLHSYLAVVGGIQNKSWLGSRSQTSTEKHLGFNTAPADTISPGYRIPLAEHCSMSAEKNESHNFSSSNPASSNFDLEQASKIAFQQKQLTPNQFYNELGMPLTLRFIPQSLWYSFTEEQHAAFCENQFTISAGSNRMGYRLSEIPDDVIPSSTDSNYHLPKLSKPVTFGSIQLPSNNQPIVLMKERQTIGGYPVLGSVIQTDLFKLSQLRPGNKVQFLPTTLSFSQQQLMAFHQKFCFSI